MSPCRLWLLLVLLCGIVSSACLAPAAVIRDVRVGQNEGYVRLVIETDSHAEYRFLNDSRTNRKIAVEITGITAAPARANLIGNIPLVNTAQVEFQRASSQAYINLGITGEVRVDASRLSNPARIVLDLYEGSGPIPSTVSSPSPSVASGSATPSPAVSSVAGGSRPRVVVIDPGHGGHHRGGIGYLAARQGQTGTVRLPSAYARDYGFQWGRVFDEAVAVMPIALELERLLRADSRFEPRLTRRTDTYVGLRERTRLAEQFRGDIFLSIHYNAVPESTNKRNARGLEMFVWSPRDAETAGARYLQDLDNEEGAGSDLSQASRAARPVLDKMAQDALAEQALESRRVAQALEGVFRTDSYIRQHYRGIKSGRFRVLENFNMPSVLVEVAFISNPDEVRMAADPEWQRRIARHLYNGIVAYYTTNDPAFRPGGALARR